MGLDYLLLTTIFILKWDPGCHTVFCWLKNCHPNVCVKLLVGSLMDWLPNEEAAYLFQPATHLTCWAHSTCTQPDPPVDGTIAMATCNEACHWPAQAGVVGRWLAGWGAAIDLTRSIQCRQNGSGWGSRVTELPATYVYIRSTCVASRGSTQQVRHQLIVGRWGWGTEATQATDIPRVTRQWDMSVGLIPWLP